MAWQQVWQRKGSRRLWSVPDRQVVALAQSWKSEPDVRRVLDLGCGIGRHLSALAREGFEVYGSDHSESAIESCRQVLQSAGYNGELWCGEMEVIPYRDGFFDAVIAFNSIYHGTFDRVDATVQVLHSKLRSGAPCFVTMASQHNRLYGKGEQVADHTFLSGAMFDQLFPGGEEDGVPHYFSSEEDLRYFFRSFRIESLEHEELQVAVPARSGDAVNWLTIPKSYFWRLVATRT